MGGEGGKHLISVSHPKKLCPAFPLLLKVIKKEGDKTNRYESIEPGNVTAWKSLPIFLLFWNPVKGRETVFNKQEFKQ